MLSRLQKLFFYFIYFIYIRFETFGIKVCAACRKIDRCMSGDLRSGFSELECGEKDGWADCEQWNAPHTEKL